MGQQSDQRLGAFHPPAHSMPHAIQAPAHPGDDGLKQLAPLSLIGGQAGRWREEYSRALQGVFQRWKVRRLEGSQDSAS